MITLNSNVIAGVEYINGQLDILFADGALMRYFGVPEAVYTYLLSSTIAAAYYDAVIKNEYRAIKIR